MASSKLLVTIVIFSLLSFSSLTSSCGTCNPRTSVPPLPAPIASPSCPRDTLKLGACVDLLGLVNLAVGTTPSSKCCALLKGLADLEAAICLCTASKANVVGINLDVPVTLSLLNSACNKSLPPDFMCMSWTWTELTLG